MIELALVIENIRTLLSSNKIVEAQVLAEKATENFPQNFDCLFLCGAIHAQLQNYQKAIKFLLYALEINPKSAIAHFNLGIIYEKQHQNDDALKHYDSAIEFQANFLEAYFNRAKVYFKKEQHRSAIEDLQTVLSINPNLAQAYGLIGNINKHIKIFDQAIDFYTKAIQLDPYLLEAFFNRGKVYFDQRAFDLAIEDFFKVISLNQQFIDAYYFLSISYKNLQIYENALHYLNLALQQNENHTNCLIERSNLYIEQKKYEPALIDLTKVINLDPMLAEAHHNHGLVLEKLFQFDDARNSYLKVLSLKPTSAETYNNLGNVSRELGKYDEAIRYFENAISIRPDYFEAYNNLGWTLHTTRNLSLSVENLMKAIELNENLSEAHVNLALSYLAQGNYSNGFLEYEWRKRLSTVNYRNLSSQLWLGDEDIMNKTIFVYYEQGLGDTIQFSRYCVILANLGANVILEVQSSLFQLFRSLKGVNYLVASENIIPHHDFHIPMMSLPLALKTNLSSIPRTTPYIEASQSKVKKWSKRLGEHTRLRVGLVWSGGYRPNQPELWSVNKRRNISFQEISKINNLDIDFYNLQKGEPAESELRTLKKSFWSSDNFIDFTNELNDFSDTAALIMNLDLLICVDTSVAHLAGALNKPVWLLNRFDTCWRWSNQSQSLWYPSIKIFTQQKNGDWTHVINDVISELKLLK